MEKLKRPVPEWKAPETLLPRVLQTIGAGKSKRLPQLQRWLLLSIGAIACIALQWASWSGPLQVIGQPIASAPAMIGHWIGRALLISGILQRIALTVLDTSNGLSLLVATGLVMAVAWYSAIAGFRFVLTTGNERNAI
jgi:predicted anti-sigma-YlaC factor YlaD